MKPISRRTLLRGAGAGLALPWLEAMGRVARAGSPSPIRRLVFLYVPNGIHMPGFGANEGPAGLTLTDTLEPLAGLSGDLLALRGLTLDKARANGDGPGDHARAASAFLTGSQPYKSKGGRIHVGISADQVAALEIGHRTRFRSLEIGCEAGRQSGECDSGYACVYSNNISWRTPHTPVAKETEPSLLFDRLFLVGGGSRSAAERSQAAGTRRSVLDVVLADAHDLEGRVGRADRRRLDEYFDSVRELERRIDALHKSGGSRVPIAEHPTGDDSHPLGYVDRVRAMYDLLALALRTDVTRIATFMLANEGSNRTYPWIEVREGHHSASHHRNETDKVEMIRRIDRFHTTELARFLGKLKQTVDDPEAGMDAGGNGSLLDSCMIVYGSGIADGNRHTHHDLPLLLAGRGGGSLDPGRLIRYPKETPVANLYLSLLDRMGVHETAHGDSDGRLDGLTSV